VANDLTEEEVLLHADALSFPKSVIEYFQGQIGLPPFGFPEPLRSKVLKGASISDQPLLPLEPYDFEAAQASLEKKWGDEADIRSLITHALYPEVFAEYQAYKREFGRLSMLTTRTFLTGLKIGEELCVDIETGKQLVIKLLSISDPSEEGLVTVHFEVNGAPRQVRVRLESFSKGKASRAKANNEIEGSIGAPMPGVVVDAKVHSGDFVDQGDPLLTLNGMKMEMTVVAPIGGTVELMEVKKGDQVESGDLLLQITRD